MKTKTGNETWKGLVRQNITRAATLLAMLLTCLTATFAKNEVVIVEFFSNAPEGNKGIGEQYFFLGESQRLDACTYHCEGHDFCGWNTEEDGSGTSFEDEQMVCFTNFSNGYVLKLYAQWKSINNTIVSTGDVSTGGSNYIEDLMTDMDAGKIDRDVNEGVHYNNNVFHFSSSSGSYEYSGSSGSSFFITTLFEYAEGKESGMASVINGQLNNNMTVMGAIPAGYVFTIADGATVTLRDLTVGNQTSAYFNYGDGVAAITCLGDATIVLEGSNSVMGVLSAPGIFVPAGKTLTIRGSGSLTAIGGSGAAGIGGRPGEDCGNIVIEAGTVTAMGGEYAAGIGSGKNASCGNIIIGNGISRVTATAGINAMPIGKGENGACGVVSTSDLSETTANGTTTLYFVENFNLWLGGTQVTADNHRDILGDGTASYDIKTHTLTLNHPTITTTTQDAVIYSEGIDLTVKGYYKMTEPLGSLGLSVTGGTLTMEGDFTFRGSTVGVSPGSSLSVKGNLRAYGGTLAIANSSSMTLEPGFFGETRVEGNGNLLYSGPGYAYAANTSDGTAEHPFVIYNSSQWRKACADVANGCATAGKHFRIGGGFYATTTMGTADNPFAGTIDGQRQLCTLTANINEPSTAACTALFPYVSGATIRNLLVKGSIVGGAGSAGLVGKALGGTTTLENCVFDGTVGAVNNQTAANRIVGAKADGATVTATNCLDVGLFQWGSDNVRAYKLTGGNGVSIAQTSTTGVTYGGAIWAPKDAVVTFTASGGNGAYAATVANTLSGPAEGVYTLTMPEDNVAILPNDAVTYTITQPGDILGGNVHANKAEAPAGSPVRISVTRADYYLLKSLTVKDADDNEIAYDEYGFFTMPASAVTITAEFVKKYTLENGVLTLKYGTFNNGEKNGFDTDVTSNKGNVTKITADFGVRFSQSVSGLFYGFANCTEIDLHNVETSAVTITANMFGDCSALKKLDMFGWDMSHVTDMSNMFYGCGELGEIDLSSLSFVAVTNASCMFQGCGVYRLTLPAGMGVTKEMRLIKGKHKDVTTWSGWQKLGDASVVSTFEQDANDPDFSYAVLPAQTEVSAFVWKEMPDGYVLDLPDGKDNRDLIALWDGMTVDVRLKGRTLYRNGDWNTLCLPFVSPGAQYLGATELIHALGNDYVINELTTMDRFNSEGERYNMWGPNPNAEDYPYQTGFNAETGELSLYFIPTYTMYPGMPYLVRWTKPNNYVAYNGTNAETCSDIVSPIFEGVTIDKTMSNVTSEDTKVQFRGNYDYRYFPAADRSILFLGSENQLFYPQTGALIGPSRSYFHVDLDGSADVRSFVLNFGDEETGIVEAEANSSLFTIHSSLSEWYSLDGRKLNAQPTKKGLYIHGGRVVVVP